MLTVWVLVLWTLVAGQPSSAVAIYPTREICEQKLMIYMKSPPSPNPSGDGGLIGLSACTPINRKIQLH